MPSLDSHAEQEAAASASRAAQNNASLEAELEAIDAIAKFKHTPLKIHEYGALIDGIDNLTPDFVKDLRKIGERINEPDLEPTAFEEHPPWSFPESSQRFQELRSSQDWSEYVRLSQSQSTQSRQSQNAQSQALSQAPSTPRMPSSNQEHQQQREKSKQQNLKIPSNTRLSPSPRRSPRSLEPPRRYAGYVMDDDGDNSNSLSSRRRQPSAGPSSNPAPATGSSSGPPPRPLQRLLPFSGSTRIELSSSESDAPIPPRRSSDTSSSKKRRRLVVDVSGSDDEGAIPTTRSPAPPTREERKQQAAAEKVPEVARQPKPRKTAYKKSKAPAAGQRSPSNDKSDNSMSEEEVIETTPARTTANKGPRTVPETNKGSSTLNNKQPEIDSMLDDSAPSRQKSDKAYAPYMEGDILLSGPARASLLNGPVSQGYEGYRYISSEWTDASRKFVKENWLCLVCNEPKLCSRSGKNSNLKSHRGRCPIPPGGIPVVLEKEDDVGQSPVKKKRKRGPTSSASSTLVGSSYHGASVAGWLNGQQAMHPDLTRRLGVVMIVRKALPFTHLATLENKAMVKSIDARATLAMVSASTVRRDLGKFYLNLQDDLKAELGGIDTLVALQHDAWTTKAFQYSFVAITASYVDSNWNFREVLLSFDVLKEKHTGATFSGHMIRTLKEMGIGDKWFGTVTSDSTGTNHRMMDILSYSGRVREMQERRGDEAVIDKKSAAAMKSSCSAFPRASMRHGGYWDPEENKILCMNHHINLAVRDGFATLGVSLKTKAQQKVLDILPVPAILVQDENGREVEVDTTSWLKDDVPDSNEDPVANDKEETQQDSPHKGKQKATEKEGSTSTRDHADGEEGDDEDGEEDDAYESSEEEEPDFGPDAEDIGSDDGGGPEAFESADKATGSTNARSHRVSAISKLEAFTISIRRGSGRRDDFRARMQKEYHRDPHLAGAPFPPKPNATRWNSHFAMIRGALKIREAIDAHCRAYIGVKGEKLGSYLLTDTEWEMLKQLRPVLKLALAATKDMEQAQGTLYKVLDHHASLRDKIKAQVKIVETDDDLDVETTAALLKFFAAMEDKLRKYRNMALRNKITLVAALLDPSNRMDLFELSYPAYTEEAEQALRDAMKELLGDEEGRQQSPPQGAASSTSSKMTALQEAKMLRMQQTEGGLRRRKDDQPDEIARYLNTNNCAWRDSDETPYKWWRDNAKEFPNLSKLARIVLAIPGTSSSVERVFSQASLFSTSKRQSLSSKALSELVSTKHWLMHGGDQLSGLSEEAIRVAESIAKLPEL